MGKQILSLIIVLASVTGAWGDQAPKPTTGEITVPPNTHMAFALSSFISTKNSQVGDQFYGRVLYPLAIDNRIVVPAGSYVRGTITEVKRAGRIKGKASIALRFDSLMLPNGVTKDLNVDLYGIHSPLGSFVRRETEKVEGDSSKGQDAGTIGATGAEGAIIGAIAGGGKGVAIGGGAGALAGVAILLLTRGRDIELGHETEFDLILKKPLTFSEKELDFGGEPLRYERGRQPVPRREQTRRSRFWPRIPLPIPFPF